MKNVLNDEINELYEVIINIKDKKEWQEFFDDLCTYKEINSMAQRLKAAKLLIEEKTYENIIK